MAFSAGTAQTIWSQIGSDVKRAIKASGAVGDDAQGYLHFEVGTRRRSPDDKVIHKIQVWLTPMDEYKVRLIRLSGMTLTTVDVLEECDGVYCDNLGEVIQDWCETHKV